MVRSLTGLLLVALLSSCRPNVREEAVEKAPYTVDSSGALILREDLVAALHSERASFSSDGAVLEGFGHVAFAPGASYAVRSPFEAYAERVLVQVGDHVEAGQVMALLRSSELARLRADLRRLSASLEMEKDALVRTQRLMTENAASSRELVETKGRVEALEAELTGVREALSATRAGVQGADRLELKAPQAGEVLSRTIEPGERVLSSDSEPAFMVGDSNSLVWAVNFPERDASLLKVGSACAATVPALGGRAFEGQLLSVVGAMDKATRTVRAICKPKDHEAALRAEMVVRAKVLARGGETLLVPRAAVLLKRDERVVFVRIAENRLERRSVRTGRQLGGAIQILSGISAGEDVVTEGAVLLDGELDQLL